MSKKELPLPMMVIMHKIDRSARNLHDWAAVGDLIDNGIQVHFAHESLDLTERGGRLSADIQAVMASDYVRNLRQEIIKGINGRLNQGLYPFKAPLGYLNNGKGKVKTKDPKRHKHIQRLFELYASGEYAVKQIADILYEEGLRNFGGNKVKDKALYKLLKKPFYIGLMEVKGKVFSGIHEPIISKELFQRAQEAIEGRYKIKGVKHDYLYRRLIRCGECKYLMSGEKQKGMVYYRCATKSCPTKTRREDYITRRIEQKFKIIKLKDNELRIIYDYIEEHTESIEAMEHAELQKMKLTKGKFRIQEEKLLEAYLDNLIDNETFQLRKKKIAEEINLIEQRERGFTKRQPFKEKIGNFLELYKHLIKPYQSSDIREKRQMLKLTTSNLYVSGKSLSITLLSPFDEMYKLAFLPQCEHSADTARTRFHKMFYLENPYITFANEWTSHLERPTFSKKQIIDWLLHINHTFKYIPPLRELLYPHLPKPKKNNIMNLGVYP